MFSFSLKSTLYFINTLIQRLKPLQTQILANSKFKNFLLMATGNFGAQAISMLFYPFLVRVFSPSDFAVFGSFSSCVVIASIFAGGQLVFALVKAKDDEKEIGRILWLIRGFSICGIIVSFFVVLFVNHFVQIFSWTQLVLFIPLLASFMGFETYKMLAVRKEQYKILSQTAALNRTSSNLFKVLIGFKYPFVSVMILSEAIANFFSSYRLHRLLSFKVLKPLNWKSELRRYSHFPLFSTFSTFFQLGLMELPVIFYASFFQKAEVGIYVLVIRMILQPLAVIGNSLGTVVSREMSDRHDNSQSQESLLIKIYAGYLGLGVVIFLFALIIPSSFYVWIFGEKWAGFKNILLPLTLLSTAKLSSGVHIFHYVASDRVKVKTLWKALQMTAVVGVIVLNRNSGFVDTLWKVSLIEASIDLAFTVFTVAHQKKVHVRFSKI